MSGPTTIEGRRQRLEALLRKATSAPKVFPLSFSQRRLWFMDQLEEDFHLSIHQVLRLEGPLNLRALELAWSRLMERQGALRTVFLPSTEEALQAVLPRLPVRLPVVDLRQIDTASSVGEPVSAGERVSEGLLQRALERRFDLQKGPLVRLLLMRFEEERHLLLLDFHHIVFDGWSMGVLHRELEHFYGEAVCGVEEGAAQEGATELPSLTTTYGEFSRRQRSKLEGEQLESLLAYWRRRLEGLEPVLELPADRPRPAKESHRGGLVAFQWPQEFASALETRCRTTGTTPFAFLLTVFQLLLSRLSGRRDVAVGIPVAGRPQADLEDLVGFFVNSLVLRTRIEGNPSFEALKRQVGARTVEALDHSELPFERLVEELRPPRDSGAAPIFQVSFQFQAMETMAPRLHGLRVVQEERDPGTAALDLSFYVEPRGDALRGFVQFSRDLYDPSTALRMAQWLRSLATAAVENSMARVFDLSMLSLGERHQLEIERPRLVEPTADESLLESIRRHAEGRPHAVAVVCGGENLTYGELWRRATSLAAVLKTEGAGLEQAVGVCLPRSLAQVPALLGVLATGAAYLPLDPSYPEGRLLTMLEDCGATMLVGDVPGAQLSRIDMHACVEGSAASAPDPVLALGSIHPESSACLLFTSGSSGRPKAVCLAVSELAHHCRNAAEAHQLTAQDVVLQFASVGFDTALEQTLSALSTGARLVLRGDEVWTAEELFAIVQTEGITVANLTTSYWQQVASEWRETGRNLGDTSLRLVIAGGEQMAPEAARTWELLTAGGGVRLLNAYGPTETTVTATLGRPEVEASRVRLAVGRPLPGRQVGVVDPQGCSVPMGVPGELVLGGRGLARCYIGRPRQTAERFLPSRFGEVPGGRIYATGDLARWRSDGQLEIVGRRDRQVKLRGFRIELGEVEAAIESLPLIRQAVALVRPDHRGEDLLVAYGVPAQGVDLDLTLDLDERSLKESLRKVLPAFLVPARIEILSALPLTKNGKVDLRALPVPTRRDLGQSDETDASPGFQALSTTGASVEAAWKEILGLESADLQQHFFELGGHSLLATRLISRINRDLGLKLKVRAVFDAPRLGGLIQWVEEATGVHEEGVALKVVAREGGYLPVSFSQERLWFLDRLTPGSPLYSIAGCLGLAGSLDLSALRLALGALIERHESLRTFFPEVKGRPTQVVAPSDGFSLPTVDLSGLEVEMGREEGQRLAEKLPLLPFDLSRGPLLRHCLLRQEGELHRLVVVLHHIISDGWSQGIFFRELSELYNASKQERPAVLPELPFQYVDYASWQRDTLTGERLESLLSFWRKTLAQPLPVMELPADRPRPPMPRFEGAFHPMDLGDDSDGLAELARDTGSTIFLVLLAGLKATLCRLTGQRDLLVGTPVANRGRPELEGIIGFFVNTLVLRTSVSEGDTFLDLLASVRESTLEASNHQEAPFERLVAELIPDRDLSHTPFFQVMLAHQDASVGRLSMEGLKATVEPLGSGTSKFDLTVYVREAEAGLEGVLEYSTDLFDATTVARLARSMVAALRSAAKSPDQSLASLSLLSPQERWQVLGEWNGPREDFGSFRALHALVEDQVDRTPEALAVLLAEEEAGDDGRVSLTYSELDQEANQLARFLGGRGVASGDLVGVVLERSLELVVALLGVLKAGAAYVPMDPGAPPDRLASMIEDTGATALLTRESLWQVMSETALPSRTEVLFVDGERSHIVSQDGSRLQLSVPPNGLAYVIYTSGSTGRPKGAMNRHRGIFNRIQWMQRAYGLGAEDRVLQKTPFTFDVSVWEFFWPLMAGARLVMARPGGHGDPAYLARTVRSQGITTMHFVPSVLGTFLEAPGVRRCTSLLRVICSGEALSRELAERFHKILRAELHNLYGPTEAAIDVTAWPCPRGEEGAVPIGRPIANTRTLVLDRWGGISPIGGEGELFLGGPNLGRGYHRRPGLTAERFRPDGFSEEPGRRLYATGDRVRWRRDGSLDFLGRIDFQVKLRGLRIELGEIESALEALASVRSAVVVVCQGASGDPQLFAYLVGEGGSAPGEDDLRQTLRKSLPEYMVPASFVTLDELPLNANGKLDRRALPDPVPQEGGAAPTIPRRGILADIAALWRDVLGVEAIDLDRSFFDLGGHSLLLVQVQKRLQSELGFDVELVELFQFPTVRTLAEHLQPELQAPRPKVSLGRQQHGGDSIAIIGMSGRFPGASSVEELWENLVEGMDAISMFSEEELESSPLLAGDPSQPGFVRAGGIVEGADLFDAELFGYPPREAEILDPQQRIFLECAWEALEMASCDPARFLGRVGVFAGVGMNSYLFTHLLANPSALQAAGGYAATLANDKDFLASRVSYKLGLRGPSVAVQTACSTSLVAVHMACRSLQSGDCELALAGGVTVRLPQRSGYLYQPSMILSPDGKCRPFAASAAGTVPGNGAGIVVLKRLEEALEDNDAILAVIRGSAVNNDGAAKVGFTAPGVSGQAEVIADALADAEVSPDTVSYVEAHGTGTELGDPIEIAALTQAFRMGTKREGYCAIGSVKSNLGHLDAAAGVAGLIKASYSLSKQYLPPTLHAEEPNSHIDFAASPFFLQDSGGPWQAEGVLRAGVSAFGIGGTNAHVVLEEPPPRPSTSSSRPLQLLLQSAAHPDALDLAGNRLADFLETEDSSLPDVAFSLQTGRQRLAHRRVVVTGEKDEAIHLLRRGGKDVRTLVGTGSQRSVAFLFSGQGSQYPGMGLELYDLEPTFRDVVDRCVEAFRGPLGYNLADVLFPATMGDEAAARLRQTAVAQPALFTVELALATLWREWGLEPKALLGHSIGELVAATIAGVFTIEGAVATVAVRGRLIQEMPPGAMATVGVSAADVEAYLPDGLAVAAINAPGSCVVSGPEAAMVAFEQAFKKSDLAVEGLEVRRLHTSHAFHSFMMEPALKPFREALRGVELHSPKLPLLSNVTGEWITSEEARDPDYWVRHLRGTVRFSDGLQKLLEDEDLLLLEVGPGEVLSSLVRQHAGTTAVVVPSLPRPGRKDSALGTMLGSLGRLWQAGAEIDWRGFYRHEERRKLALPTYPFQRQRFMVEPQSEGAGLLQDTTPPPLQEWFSLPSWQRCGAVLGRRSQPTEKGAGTWLLFLDSLGLGGELMELLRSRGEGVITVSAGEEFSRLAEGTYLVNPTSAEDHGALFRSLESKPTRILHLWCLAPNLEHPGDSPSRRFPLECLVALAQALIQEFGDQEVEVGVVSSGLHRIDHRDRFEPRKSLLLGPCRVLQQEHPNLSCRSIDVGLDDVATGKGLAGTLVMEMEAPPSDGVVLAYRGGRRWVESLEPLILEKLTTRPRRLRDGGVYLITGGLGKVGMVLARALAQEVPAARIVLLGRSEFPPPEQWKSWVEGHGTADFVSEKIQQLQELEELGAKVLVLQADVARRTDMARALHRAEEEFGQIHGIFHAAGVASKALAVPMAILRQEDMDRHLDAKVGGLEILKELLVERQLDFLLVTSSTSSLLGGLGLSLYASANLCIDAMVQQEADSGEPWMSVNWDGWALDASEEGVADRQPASLTQETGSEALLRLLDVPEDPAFSRVLVSPRRLVPLMEKWLRVENLRRLVAGPAADGGGYERPNLAAVFVAPSTEIEKTIAELWHQLLGIEPIGVNDDFFELGGHSLLATQLLSRMREQLGTEMSLDQVFQHPTVAELAAAVDGGGGSQLPAIVPVPRDRPLRLSFAQERMWLLYRFDPAGIAYNLPAAIRLRGDLDVHALRKTYDAVVQRHEILRTRFIEVEGRPAQEVLGKSSYSLPVVDLGDLSQELQESELRRLAVDQGNRPFDLGAGEVFRNVLLRLQHRHHAFLSACHHIVTDGWSGGLSVAEIASLYPGFLRGQGKVLPPLPFQFADFAEWQREWLSGEVLEDLLGYWREQLKDRSPLLALPTDRPRTAASRSAGRLEMRIGESTVAGLRRLAQRIESSLFMVSMAGIMALLQRYSGDLDLSVGTATASRHLPGTEHLLGVFINTLVVRVSLAEDPLVGEFLGRVRQASLGAYAHQDLPFDKLVEALKPSRDPGGQTFFRVLMAFNHEPPPTPRLEGLDLDVLDLGPREDEAMFDLSLGLTDEGDVLSASVQYNSALFDATTVERWMRNLRTLLAGLIEEQELRLSELPLLGFGERHQLAIEWSTARSLARSPAKTVAGDRDRQIRILGPNGELAPMGAWGALREVGSPVSSPQVARGRFLATGVVQLEKSSAEDLRAGGEDQEAAAQERWRRVENRQDRLSARKKQLLEARLAGRLGTRDRKPSTLPEKLFPKLDGALVAIQASGDRPPLFCVHAVAGDVTSYMDLARELGSDQPFYGLQAPGLGEGQTAFRSLQDMARHYVEAVRKARPEGPYVLAGWSMGGVVAYEMAQQLRQGHGEVSLLMLLEPSVPGLGRTTAVEAGISSLVQDLESRLGRRLLPTWRELAGPGHDRQARYLLKMAQQEGMEEAGTVGGDWPQLLQVYENNVTLLQSYHPASYSGEAVLVTVEHGPQREAREDPRLFWQRLIGPNLGLFHVAGSHTSMLRRPYVKELANLLRRSLDLSLARS